MWRTKTFKSREAMCWWLGQFGSRIQWHEIFVNNAYGLEYRWLRSI